MDTDDEEAGDDEFAAFCCGKYAWVAESVMIASLEMSEVVDDLAELTILTVLYMVWACAGVCEDAVEVGEVEV